MDDLVEFLRARLAEEEEAATRAAEDTCPTWTPATRYLHHGRTGGRIRIKVYGRREYLFSSETDGTVVEHIARHDPARVLRDVEAKRRIIERYERAVEVGGRSSSGFTRGQDDGYIQACLDAIKDTAGAYDSHPDYLEKWKP